MNVTGHVTSNGIIGLLFPDIGEAFMFGFLFRLREGLVAAKCIEKEYAVIRQ